MVWMQLGIQFNLFKNISSHLKKELYEIKFQHNVRVWKIKFHKAVKGLCKNVLQQSLYLPW